MAQYSDTVQSLLTHIDSLKAQIEAMRPIKPELVSRIFQKYRLEWNYNSNSIEGNSLSYGETVAFLMEGLTAKGKPLKDHLDIKGHNEAIDFLLDMQKQGSELMERDIRSLHEMILVEPYQSKAQTADGHATTKTIQLGVYKSSPNHVVTRTGETHYYATPEETPALMQDLMAWYRDNLLTMHPLVLSTLFHHRFVNIHPFDDGNGRMSRLLSNLILMQSGFPPVVVRQDQKSEYYGVLSQADAGVTDPLLEYFGELLINSLEVYLKGARGEAISEPSDLDKEIALFVASFDEDQVAKVAFDQDVALGLGDIVFKPLFSELISRILKISALFFDTTVTVTIEFVHDKTVSAKGAFNPFGIKDFYDQWILDDKISRNINDFYKENYKSGKDQSVIVGLRIVYKTFKPNDLIDYVGESIFFSFGRAGYSVAIVTDNNVNVKGFYPMPMKQDNIHVLVEGFARNIMNKIKNLLSKVG